MTKIILLLLAAGMDREDAAAVSHIRFTPPGAGLIAAIISHESHGKPNVCNDEADGSSSRGLMQINHKNSRCNEEGDRKYIDDFDPVHNVKSGILILKKCKEYHLKHCTHPHDWLEHYAGRGKDAKRFAKEIRKIVRELPR